MKNILKEELEINEEGILIIDEEEISVKCVKSEPDHEYEGGCKLCIGFNLIKRCTNGSPLCCAHNRKDRTNVHFIKINSQRRNPAMATKFMSLDTNPVVKKQTKFTHYLNEFKIVIENHNNYPSDWNNILHIGTDKCYGDIFKAWDDGKENNFVIFFGEQGDEFE